MLASRWSSFVIDSCVCGYMWIKQFGIQWFACSRERGNSHDLLALVVKKDGNIVGHVPREILCIYILYICNGGVLQCTITSSRCYSHDILQGGIEILCIYTFSGSTNLNEKTRRHLEELQEKVSAIRGIQNCTNTAMKSNVRIMFIERADLHGSCSLPYK